MLNNHLLEILIAHLDECLTNIQSDLTQWTQLGMKKEKKKKLFELIQLEIFNLLLL